MLHDGDGVLLWMLQPRPEAEAEWNTWYDTEHVPALMRVAGFLNGSRYRLESSLAGATPPRYLAYYELEGLGVLQSDDYHRNRASLGEGMRADWTRRMLEAVTHAAGGIYTVAGQWRRPGAAPAATPPALLTVGVGRDAAASEWAAQTLQPLLRRPEGVADYRVLSLAAGSPRIAGMREREESSHRLLLCALEDVGQAERLWGLARAEAPASGLVAVYAPILSATGTATSAR